MPMTPLLAQMITQNKTALELKEQCISQGMRTLQMDGIAKVEQGITTLEEVAREARA